MNAVIHYFEEFNMVSVTIRMVLALLCGGLVGVERATKRRAAGLRTFALVSLGSASAMITNQYLNLQAGGIGDQSRMAAQVISGIGFLGVGTIIINRKSHVTGLTTAACLWTTATMGIAIGSGFLFGGILTFLLIVIDIHFLQWVSHYQEENNRYMEVLVEVDGKTGYRTIMNYFETQTYLVRSVEKKTQQPIVETNIVLLLKLDLKKKCNHQEVVSNLCQLVEGVHYVEEIK